MSHFNLVSTLETLFNIMDSQVIEATDNDQFDSISK
jgi:hypothetical protein